MKILAVYIVIVIVGTLIAVGVGLVVEKFSVAASQPVGLALFFFTFWAGWKLAVRLT